MSRTTKIKRDKSTKIKKKNKKKRHNKNLMEPPTPLTSWSLKVSDNFFWIKKKKLINILLLFHIPLNNKKKSNTPQFNQTKLLNNPKVIGSKHSKVELIIIINTKIKRYNKKL